MKVRNAGTEQDLGIQYKALKPEVDRLNVMAAKRQQVKCSHSLHPMLRDLISFRDVLGLCITKNLAVRYI